MDTLVLKEKSVSSVKLHPTVLFAILDQYLRRPTDLSWVTGMILANTFYNCFSLIVLLMFDASLRNFRHTYGHRQEWGCGGHQLFPCQIEAENVRRRPPVGS